MEWRHTLIRGDRFSLVAEFSPRSDYQLTGHNTPPGILNPMR